MSNYKTRISKDFLYMVKEIGEKSRLTSQNGYIGRRIVHNLRRGELLENYQRKF